MLLKNTTVNANDNHFARHGLWITYKPSQKYFDEYLPIAKYCISKFVKSPWKNSAQSYEYACAETSIIWELDKVEVLAEHPEWKKSHLVTMLAVILRISKVEILQDKNLPF